MFEQLAVDVDMNLNTGWRGGYSEAVHICVVLVA